MKCCKTLPTPNSLWPPESPFCCPADSECQATGPFSGRCVPTAATGHPPLPSTNACKGGPGQLPMFQDIGNVLVLGDSVSIGYTPFLSLMLRDKLSIQHTPWDETDGGAGATDEGLLCLDFWLRDLEHQLLSPAPVAIVWNFGIHDTPVWCQPINNATCLADAAATYKANLLALHSRITALYPTAKQLFALTTPIPYNKSYDDAMVRYNAIATEELKPLGVGIADLYSAVITYCGPTPYYNCSIALNRDPAHPNPHYNPDGYIYLMNGTLVPAVKRLLGPSA